MITQPPDSNPIRLIAVVDSNVFLHAKWLRPIVAATRRRFILPIWTPLIVAEVSRVLAWFWLDSHGGDTSAAAKRACGEEAKRWFAAMTDVFRVVDDHPPHEDAWPTGPRDHWDLPIWSAAVRARRQFGLESVVIVTENLRDGPPDGPAGLGSRVREYDGIFYLHPEIFVVLIDMIADGTVTAELDTNDDPARVAVDRDQVIRGADLPEPFRDFLDELRQRA